jgi:uncharacterized protein
MGSPWRMTLSGLMLCGVMVSMPVRAGLDEGMAAYKKSNFRAALKEFMPLAMQGNAVAQSNLGVMYANGQGVPQDDTEAVKWYRLAANQGDATAQSNLGLMYAKGQGVSQDYSEAARWYRLAANQGDAWAQNNLGVLYKDGKGVPESRIVAYALYTLSAATDPGSGNNATSNRANLAKEMAVREIESGQLLIKEMGKPGNLLKALDRRMTFREATSQ